MVAPENNLRIETMNERNEVEGLKQDLLDLTRTFTELKREADFLRGLSEGRAVQLARLEERISRNRESANAAIAEAKAVVEHRATVKRAAVETGIPAPKPVRRGKPGRPLNFQWKRMKVGDSLFFPGATATTLGGSFGRYVKRHNLRRLFTARTVVEGGKAGARVWRLK
jgi:hypothetical protein